MIKKSFTLTISEDKLNSVRNLASVNNTTPTEIINLAIDNFMGNPNGIKSRYIYASLIELYDTVNKVENEYVKMELLERISDIICHL